MMHKRSSIALGALLVTASSLVLAGCGPNLFDRVANFWSLSCCGIVIVVLDIIALLELAGSNRSTGDKVLWALLIIFFPVGGLILYYFFGRR
jgi:cytochrome bd-type quinol oxidase subunit 2